MRGMNLLKILFITLILAIGLCFTVEALTLKEAISLAKKAYPPLKEKIHLYEQNRFLYKASFDPYFPTLSSDLSYQRTFESSLNSIGRLWDNQCTLGLTLNYRLFDGGYRYSIKEQTLHTFDQAQTDIKIIENDLNYMVKEAFYTALVKEKILQIRKEAEEIAKKNYELALAKRKAGLAMLSDVTQAQVRYTNARMETITAKKALEKAIAELNSLIGWSLDKKTKLEGKLKTTWINATLSVLEALASQKRPEIERQLLETKKAKEAIREYKSNYYPKLDTQLSYYRYDNDPNFAEKEAVVSVTLSYDIFDGFGRYHKVTAQKQALQAAQAQLAEIKRQIRLEVYQTYKDLELAFSNYQIASELVKEAQVNYNQAYGEYKVGKGDIISLIQSELNLAQSKIDWAQQLLNYNIAISALERAVFTNLIE